MKRAVRFIVILALLTVVQLANAQSKIGGKLTNDGHTMEWSVSGITVTKKGKPRLESSVMSSAGEGDLKQDIEGTVTPGTTITANLKKISGKKMPRIYIDFDYRKTGDPIFMPGHLIQLEDKEYMSKSFTVPSNAETVDIFITYRTPDPHPRACALEMNVYIRLDVKGRATTPTPPDPPKPEECDCDYIRSDIGYNMIDSHIRFNDFYGEVKMRPNWEEDDSYEFVDLDDVIYECYRIKTEEESGAILGLEDMSTYVMKPESILIIKTEEENISKFQMLMGSLWANIKKMAEGKSLECEMSQCVAGTTDGNNGMPLELRLYYGKHTIHEWEQMGVDVPNGNIFKGNPADDNIVFACDVKNGVGTAYVFKGTMTIKNKNNKKYTLKAGQSGTIGKDSKITVKKFDAKKIAKKFGITNADLQGYRKPTLSATNTATVVKRYEMERAIVKYKVTKGNRQGVLAKAFDKYGRYERRELQMGNRQTVALLQDNVSYSLDRSTKMAKRTKDADLNFLNLNEALMKKLNLKKKGTKRVLGKDCILYEGKNVQFYVWKGLVMKKVQKESDGTTTIHEVTSIEEPTSVDPSLFKVPSGYTVK